ncbi:hypothetical protein [Mesotoga sp.]|uniref:hypothetical protein n=1 Tax=Mesotoga sp. TaxID=2053577 RepID=UPI001BD6C7B6|nr:hypothetical protein [Mesotoga sp.]MDD3460597.1 hypothetical protein [Mesotoga sp.]
MRYRVRSCLFPTGYSDNWETVEKLQLHESLSEGKFKPSSSSRPSEPASFDPDYWQKVEQHLEETYFGNSFRSIPKSILEEFITTVLSLPDRYVYIERSNHMSGM